MLFARFRSGYSLSAIFLVLVVAASPGAASGPGSVASALSDRLTRAKGALSIDGVPLDATRLNRIYAPRDFVPLWIDAGGNAAKADVIIDRLKRADQDGLNPADYGVAAIESRGAVKDSAALADLDLLLTQGLVRFGGDVRVGRVSPEVIDPALKPFARNRDGDALIAAALAADDLGDYLDGLGPSDPRYRRLKRTLRWYRDIAAKGGWPDIPDGETLKPGMHDPRVRALRERMAITGDIFGIPKDPDLFDPNVERAVRFFQQRHGLDVDGAVGRKTRQAMNVQVERRIAAIVLNLERRRWLATDLGKRFVFVNIADAVVKLIDDDKTLLDMRAVVGTPFHMTPVFSEEITYLRLNPYWNVPSSIARRELLPKAKEDPRYLSDRGIRVLPRGSGQGAWVDAATIDWSAISASKFPYRLRQDPGPRNALGRVKIMFPNEYSVYLHDTPSRNLFGKSVRAFSHGCIRLHKPLRLAEMLLADQVKWNRKAIDAVLESKQTKTVRLTKPIPVHISYLTAWVNKDGSVHFRPDVYGRDKRLASAVREHASR